VKIAIIVEGKAERVFAPVLKSFLPKRLKEIPNLDFVPQDGRIPKGDKLKRVVGNLLGGRAAADHVIAVTDVYTGTEEFVDAADAKAKMRKWVGDDPRFHPHAAQYDFEAWLLPYWKTIQKIAGHNKTSPGSNPELVNHNKPPSHHIREIFEAGECKRSYVKPRDAKKILESQDLMDAIQKCPEFKALVNTILELSGGKPIP